ncbi:exosome component 2 [Phyllostomus discolor]|uniref:Exosome component 2 n=1 Tax=Phyllostomus discolor TaxID=89673 RepID=A0A834ENX8_9CHIR|nr:exosome component 2 [Phyllostomus discolor]
MNLPGGELRRRSAEDELAMRGFLQEGDLISAEVQAVFSDGAVSLHTRSLKYGKLGQGVLVQVSPSLVKRQKTHFHDLPCGASVILGNNGFVWIYPTPEHREEDVGGFVTNLEPVSLADREVISRLRNCVVSLVTQRMMLYDTSILYCYEASLPHQVLHSGLPCCPLLSEQEPRVDRFAPGFLRDGTHTLQRNAFTTSFSVVRAALVRVR